MTIAEDTIINDHVDGEPAAPSAGATADQPSRAAAVGRLAAIGFILGFVLVTTAVAIGGVMAGQDLVPMLGVGIFVGYWGGGGFGFMLGATIPLALHNDAQGHRRADGDASTA